MTKKELNKKILWIYKERQKAHDILLACDKALDVLLKYLLK